MMQYFTRDDERAALARAECALANHAPVLERARQAWIDAQQEAAVLTAAAQAIRAKIEYDEKIDTMVAASATERELAASVAH